jgi:hypothetical protein
MVQRSYKVRFDEFNNNKGPDMSKDTFLDVLRKFNIKLTPMERNEILADQIISLDEFASILKSRDVEFMELPADPIELNRFKLVSFFFFFFKKFIRCAFSAMIISETVRRCCSFEMIYA